jgi:hypothetical protein
MKVNFRLPNTKMCLVLCYSNNKPSIPLPEVLIPTPATNEVLRSLMRNMGIGYGQIRAVKKVDETDLQTAINRNFGRT